MRISKYINTTDKAIYLFLILVIIISLFPLEIWADESEMVEQDTLINSISGVLWLDANEDGQKDADEACIDNYPVYLYTADNLNEAVANTVTNQNGLYMFTDIEVGEYVVGIKSGDNNTNYLLPLVNESDNKFTIDAENETSAFTKIITIESKTIAENMDGGIRKKTDISKRNVNGGYIVTKDDPFETVGTTNSLAAAVRLCSSNNIRYTITLKDNDPNINGTATIPKNRNITLTSDPGGPYTITQKQSARHLNVVGTLRLNNIILAGAGFNSSSRYTGGVYINGGTLTMQNNASLTNCYNENGGAVYVNGKANTSKFEMTGGTIHNNKAINGGGVAAMDGTTFNMFGTALIENNAASNGSGVYIANGSFFNMFEKARIQNNTATKDALGGGVCVRFSSTFNMYDNAVIENNNAKSGAGTYLDNSTMNMSANASIINNQASNEGGGVSANIRSTLNMKNSATVSSNNANVAGGVLIAYSGGDFSNLNMYDSSKIIDNKTTTNGGGVFSAGKIMMSDNAEISGNIADNNIYVNVANGGGISMNMSTASVTLNDKAKVTRNTASSNGGGIFAFNGTVNMNNNATISENTAKFEGEDGGGGGVYLNDYGYLNMMGGTIVNNHADTAMGGGVFTKNCQYQDPVKNFTTYYNNITIKDKDNKTFSPFYGNTAIKKYKAPSNADQSTQFNGYDLTNYNINYKSEKVYYPLEFYKVDADSVDNYKYLEGAEFNLYYWIGNDNPSKTVDINTPRNWELITTLTSDERGLVQYEDLEITKYYQLVEVKAPDGYSAADGQWRIHFTEDYETAFPYGYCSVIDHAPEIIKIDGEDKYILTNKKIPPTYDLNFIKVDATNDMALEGAKFELYRWTETEIPTALVSGENWEITGHTYTSGSDGLVDLRELSYDTYYQLVEVTAPANYKTPTGQWLLYKSSPTEEIKITGVKGQDGVLPPAFSQNGSAISQYELGNMPNYDLPEMGGVGFTPFLIIGCVLIAGAVIAFAYNHRRARIRQSN
ncbi:MAG: SpaA isopeptide-forming pilin-related protein [Lachnospiraceae bacterium]